MPTIVLQSFYCWTRRKLTLHQNPLFRSGSSLLLAFVYPNTIILQVYQREKFHFKLELLILIQLNKWKNTFFITPEGALETKPTTTRVTKNISSFQSVRLYNAGILEKLWLPFSLGIQNLFINWLVVLYLVFIWGKREVNSPQSRVTWKTTTLMYLYNKFHWHQPVWFGFLIEMRSHATLSRHISFEFCLLWSSFNGRSISLYNVWDMMIWLCCVII